MPHQITVPNLFSFATKELAQDAALAYIISWARPEYRESHKRSHELGTAMLCALLESAHPQFEIPTFNSVCVDTQYNRIDILVRINDNDIVLLIESKIDTDEHSNQILRYIEVAEECFPNSEIVAVYLKTGNVSRSNLPPEDVCGHFLRENLLAVLREYCDTDDTIIDNFFAHWNNWEKVTNQYLEIPVDNWDTADWRIYQGFYNDLENRMENWPDIESWGWGYVPNPQGGFQCFPFGGWETPNTDYSDQVYLQIHDATRLSLRLGGWDTGVTIRSPIMHRAYNLLTEINENFANININIAGVYRGGTSAAVADFTVEGQNDYIARRNDGTVDMQLTMQYLQQIIEIAANLAVQLNDGED